MNLVSILLTKSTLLTSYHSGFIAGSRGSHDVPHHPLRILHMVAEAKTVDGSLTLNSLVRLVIH